MPRRLSKFNTAAILSTDPWRITHLELLALAEEGPEVFEAPAKVMNALPVHQHRTAVDRAVAAGRG